MVCLPPPRRFFSSSLGVNRRLAHMMSINLAKDLLLSPNLRPFLPAALEQIRFRSLSFLGGASGLSSSYRLPRKFDTPSPVICVPPLPPPLDNRQRGCFFFNFKPYSRRRGLRSPVGAKISSPLFCSLLFRIGCVLPINRYYLSLFLPSLREIVAGGGPSTYFPSDPRAEERGATFFFPTYPPLLSQRIRLASPRSRGRWESRVFLSPLSLPPPSSLQ